MLGLQLKLTPAQVRFLIIMTYADIPKYKDANGNEREGLPLEMASFSQLINTGAALQRRGLMDHDGKKWIVTDEGRAVASLVYTHAKAITKLVESSNVNAESKVAI